VEAELASAAERGGAARHDARRIVERASGYDGAELMLHLDERAPDRARLGCARMIARRQAGAPLQYAIGAWGFRSLELYLDGRVLIPRPETEYVVEVALEELLRLDVPAPVVVDLGTGSGAIALSIAAEARGVEVWGTDASDDALAVARANLAGLGGRAAARVHLAHGDWFTALPDDLRGQVHLVVSNPPYVADDEVLPVGVDEWEPAGALRAGPTGMEGIVAILGGAPHWLTRPGAAVVEVAPHQADEATALARASGFTNVDVRADLSRRPRALVARV
jgi:release factor glutamine methyltransferase